MKLYDKWAVIPLICVFLSLVFHCASTATRPILFSGPLNTSPIASLEKITLGGVDQWILVRGNDSSKPILLKLHGGPGQAEMATAPYNSFLEKDFIVVEWDQRGSGKSYSSIEPESDMTIDQIVLDTIELTKYLSARFKKDKILLVGHSWGSVIALKAAKYNPNLFYAIATTGQIISLKKSGQISFSYLLEKSKALGDTEAEKELLSIGPPPYLGEGVEQKFSTYFRYLQKYKADWHATEPLPRVRLMLSSPEYGWLEKLKFMGAANRSFLLFYPELARVDLSREIQRLNVPVYFCLGRHDYLQPGVIAEQFLLELSAPKKEVMWFENSGHFPFLEENEAFARFLKSIPSN